MPLFTLSANFDVEEVKLVGLLKEIIQSLATLMKKNPEYYMPIWSKQTMVLGLTTDPALFITLQSIGQINAELNAQYSVLICSFFEEKLGVAKERIFINFVDLKGANTGNDGITLTMFD